MWMLRRSGLISVDRPERVVWVPYHCLARSGHRRVIGGLASVGAVIDRSSPREVACLYGFTRFEPAPLANDDLEDVGLAVRGAPLGQSPDWLPAVEQFGEGIFIQFSSDALSKWLSRPPSFSAPNSSRQASRSGLRQSALMESSVSQTQVSERARLEYIMAHSLSHALMSEVAIDCGYPASALKEHIYVLPRLPGEAIRCGVLIYTASAGNQGTLGGLVEVTQRLRAHPQVRPRARAAMFRRPRLRRPRSGSRPSRPHAARRRVPWLPARL